MRILILPKYYREGSSSRYRYYNYLYWLNKAGHAVTIRPLLYNGYVHDLYKNKNGLKRALMTPSGIAARMFYLLFNKTKFDLIIIEKELVTFMPFFLEKWLLANTVFMLDYDDNIHARYQTGWARIILSKKILQLGKLAAAITVGNYWYLHFYAQADQFRVHYLPTVIDRDLYTITNLKKADAPLIIVWIGSPSTVKYLTGIDDLLAGLQTVYNFSLHIIGAAIQLKTKSVFIEWSEATEISELVRSDIGIMPLKDTNWEKGKCGLKLIQYMAAGLPVVASYTEANNEIVGHNSGFTASTKKEWVDALTRLLQSAALRQKLGENARARAYQHFSYQTWAPVLVDLISKLDHLDIDKTKPTLPGI